MIKVKLLDVRLESISEGDIVYFDNYFWIVVKNKYTFLHNHNYIEVYRKTFMGNKVAEVYKHDFPKIPCLIIDEKIRKKK